MPTEPPAIAPPAARRSSGSIPLFRLFGVDVSLHWLWFLVAWYEISTRRGEYSSVLWNIAEYCTLFLIVLMHEFGHALACKSVGGKADRIMLWPLGGVAFVQPPQRPGALLWSIAAGPLVNVFLVPVTVGLYFWLDSANFAVGADLLHYLRTIMLMNVMLLIFNLLPIYPLDGGQILRALLWFIIGRAKSLKVSSVIGLLGALTVLALALYNMNVWFIALALFGLMVSLQGLAQARAMDQVASLPRHEHITCPGCGQSPPAGPFWGCSCGARFDTFMHGGICPRCGKPFEKTACPHCGQQFAYAQWTRGVVPYAFPVMPMPAQASTPPPPTAASFDSSKYFP